MVVADQLCLDFQKMNLEVMQYGEVEKMFSALTIQPSMFDQIREAQLKDEKMEKIKKKVREGHAGDFEIHEDGSLRMEGRWCIPEACEDLKLKIMEKVKSEHKRPQGKVQPLDVPGWKWDSFRWISFCLPKGKSGNDTIWVIVDRLTKSAVFIPMKATWSMDQLAKAYIKHKLHQAFGSKLLMSTAFHPATDGQTERTIQTLEDMLRACVMEYQGSWEDHLDLIEFSYNNSYHSKTVQQVKMIQGKIKAAQDRQKSYADLKRREEEYELRRYIPDKSHVLQPETVQIDENLSYEERPIKILDSKVRSTRNKDVKIVKVLWSNQKSEEATWEAEADMRKKYPELFAEG
ncbi:uncharacterized protein LOC130589956 [Beta vulgaris subsp. vulgaris]|uniref:uncharacterized protein LOC130589956 n=1 Tax=Beta vulgaris subsp. vulgaris TaxID=3555 RepID=UPI002546BFF4|nr:uncharacterized protein LOC130589956 [Beta vulgaris subsp. vulgaris]